MTLSTAAPDVGSTHRVAVSGARSGTAPLTWGQRAILRIIDMLGDDAHTSNVCAWRPCPEGTDLAGALDLVRSLLTRYEALRTTFPERDGDRVQVLAGAGSVEVEVVPAEGADPAQVAIGVRARLRETRFDLTGPWPVRFALVAERGTVHAIVICCSHATCDLWGVRALEPAIAAGAGGRVPAGVQPLDRAAFENSPAGAQTNRRAMDYLRRQLTAMPQTLFPWDAAPAHEGRRFWYAEFESPVLTAALPVLARRHRLSMSTILYAATAALLTRGTGFDSCPLGVVSANRAGARDCFGTLSQLNLATVPVAGRTWEQLLRGASAASLDAFKFGAYDPRSFDAVVDEVQHARGVALDRSLWFNDLRRPELPEVLEPDRREPGSGKARWVNANDEGDSTFYVYVQSFGGEVSLYVMVDSHYLPIPAAEQLLSGLDRVLAEAAWDELPGGHLTALPAAADPWPREEDWILVDACRVRLRAVRDVLAQTGDWSAIGLFVETTPEGRDRLVAHLVPAAGSVTPAEVHAACLEALPRHRSAVAPHHYVIHATAPTDCSNPDAWLGQAVIGEGDGRRAETSAGGEWTS